MPTRNTPWPAGTPTWIDAAVADPAAARDFYRDLFGWEWQIGPDETHNYATAVLGGHAVGGLNGQPVTDHPPYWLTYLATDDADATAARVEQAGGVVFMPPMDVLDLGRMALFQTPSSGFFGVWQAGTRTGVGIANETGTLIWNEFVTRDYAGAKDFYAHVFGYTYTALGDQYSTIEVDGATVGGIGVMPEAVPDHVPAHWRVYFKVDDTDAAVARVTELGGSVSVEPQDMPYGRWADVADPQGAGFSVLRPPA